MLAEFRIMLFFSISLGLGTSCRVWAHGGDGHDVSYLSMRGADAEHEDEHSASRLHLGLTLSTWGQVSSDHVVEREELASRSERQALLTTSMELTEQLLVNAAFSISDFSGCGDPTLGLTFVRPLQGAQIQTFSTLGLAAPLSIESQADKRWTTLIASTGFVHEQSRWSFLVLGTLGLPVRGSVRGQAQEAGDSAEKHAGSVESLRSGLAVANEYRISHKWKIEALANLNVLSQNDRSLRFLSEWLLTKITYVKPSWETGVGFGVNDESTYFRVPADALVRATIVTRY